MHATLRRFGELEIDGHRYTHDVIVEGGRVRRRHKGPSKPYRERYGHTPLSVDEAIPWSARRLIVGTGADGRLPVMPEVLDEARKRGVEVVERPTPEACRLLSAEDDRVAAVLHVTC